MKLTLCLFTLLSLLVSAPSYANSKNSIELPSSSKKCSLEDWNWENNIHGIKLHGSVSCYSGKINLKLYCDNKYLANGYAYIKKAGNFREDFSKIECASTLTVKYAIEE